MAESEQTQSKWEGKTIGELKGQAAKQVWPLLADFCNLHKWLPILDTCYLLEGVPGQPGLIRYCATPPTDPHDETTIQWTKEKLLMIDPIKHCLSYNITENNLGLNSYVAIMRLVPGNREDGSIGCKIEWSFDCDPAEGWKYEDLLGFFDSSMKLMVKNMEDALLSIPG